MEILGTPIRVRCPKCECNFSRVIGFTNNKIVYACCDCFHQYSKKEKYFESRIQVPIRQSAFS